MFPPATREARAPTPGSQLTRRGRLLAGLAVAGVLAVMVFGAWLSIRAFTPAAPVYGNATSAPATTWTWDGADFTPRTAAAGPSSNLTDMAFDEARGVIVAWDHGCTKLVMGFWGGCQAQADQTWTWDGSAWSKAAADATPRPVGRGAMLYDASLRQVVYVNGVGQAWSWTGGGWRPLTLSGAPHVEAPGSAARNDSFAAGYDEGRGLLVYALTATTWTWDGHAWKSFESGIPLAEATSQPLLVFDRAAGELVYAGRHQTWTWDGAAWTGHAQPALTAPALAYDPVRRQVLALQEDPSECTRTACSTAAWTWDGTSWSALHPAHLPELALSRSGANPPPMTFDEARGVMVLFAATN